MLAAAGPSHKIQLTDTFTHVRISIAGLQIHVGFCSKCKADLHAKRKEIQIVDIQWDSISWIQAAKR